jgi:hypothetical protein
MAVPTSRDSLIEYCLRRLGAPVIEINVDPDQIEDKVDDALSKYADYHSEGTLRTYLAHQITSTDVTNQYITLDPKIIYVTRMFPISSGLGTSRGMFDIKYQMMLNDITSMYNYIGDLAYHEQINQYVSLIDFQLNGTPQIRFSRRQNRLYLDGDFVDGDVKAGDYVVAEVMAKIDPATFTAVWNDTFMKDYTTALIKQQWGANMMKFEGMQLPGGITLNGYQYFQDASADIERILDEMRLVHELPIDFYIG